MAKDKTIINAPPQQGLMSVAIQREIAEIHGAMMLARMYPRDEKLCIDRIIQACTRPKLAEKAMYEYSRGGTPIVGPSIRLAEVLAQNWGNLDCGVRELEQTDGESVVEAFARDLETNFADRKIFQVPHIRYSREKGNVLLTDPRDIYEVVANNGARRKRACILAVIPGEIQEIAMKQCDVTLASKAEVTPERLKNLVEMFHEVGIVQEQIEKRIQRRLDAITPALLIRLGKIYNSIKDGMSKAADWFDPLPTAPAAAPATGSIGLDDLKPAEPAQPAAEAKPGAAAPAAEAVKTEKPAEPAPSKEPPKGKAALQLYDLCRGRGMTDADILGLLGRHGLEGLGEVKAANLPDLVKDAEQWVRPKNGTKNGGLFE